MSKAKLRKELASLETEQLIEVILEAYDAHPKIKEYFEYFVNPNIEKLLERYTSKLEKEILRYRRGYSKMRVTVVKQLLNEVATRKPSVEEEMKLRKHVLHLLGSILTAYYTTATQQRLVGYCTTEFLKFANQNGVASEAIATLNVFIENRSFAFEFRNEIAKAIEDNNY